MSTCPLCPHPRSEHWRGDHSCQHVDRDARPDRTSWMRDRWCPCPGTAPTPWSL